jgi:hypothetical protein
VIAAPRKGHLLIGNVVVKILMFQICDTVGGLLDLNLSVSNPIRCEQGPALLNDGITLVACRVNVKMSRDEWSMAVRVCLSLLSRDSASKQSRCDSLDDSLFCLGNNALQCDCSLFLMCFFLLDLPPCLFDVSQLGECQDEGARKKQGSNKPCDSNEKESQKMSPTRIPGISTVNSSPILIQTTKIPAALRRDCYPDPSRRTDRAVLRQIQFTGTV